MTGVLAMGAAPPPGAHQVQLLLLQLGVLLLLAFCLGRLAVRCGLPAVVGELSTGVLLGPSVLGATAPGLADRLLPSAPEQAHLLDAVAQFAVVMFVGVAGSQMDMGMVRRRRGVLAKVSLSALLVPLGLGVAAGFLVPRALMGDSAQRPVFALFLGVALSVSAIPVIAKTLTDMRLMHRNVGQLTLASAAVSDAVAWFLLSLVSTMAVGALTAGDIGLALLSLAGFVAVMAFVGGPLVRGVMRRVNRVGDAGTAAATAAIVILLGAAACQALELEAVFGAFVAGVLISSKVDERLLAPLRSVTLAVLAPLFLATAGLRVDLTAMADPAVLLAGAAVLALATLGKFAGAYLGARLGRLGHWEGIALGAGLNARGAVEIVVATVGLRLGILTTATYTIVVMIAVATSVMAPPLLRRAMNRIEQTAEESLREAGTAPGGSDRVRQPLPETPIMADERKTP
ncbi:cation:proton antiporter [Streptomyces sp. JL1001]|uniref:Cation:proton antiporter n=1 Tax=Streptomyces sp. JL1001 TaxID=3078227 RepID=A0AAU8KCR5_9ACTN